jgi:glyoxylate reductase
MLKLFVTRTLPDAAMQKLAELFHLNVNSDDRVLTPDELAAGVRDADMLLCLLTDTIDRRIIDAGPKLRGIVNYAVGFNNIDVEYATSAVCPLQTPPAYSPTPPPTWPGRSCSP